MYIRGIDLASVSMIFQLDVGIVLTVLISIRQKIKYCLFPQTRPTLKNLCDSNYFIVDIHVEQELFFYWLDIYICIIIVKVLKILF